jgi:hypothetical protein
MVEVSTMALTRGWAERNPADAAGARRVRAT